MNEFQTLVAEYKEIFNTFTMREIAEEMGWEFPLRSGYRKHEAVRDAAIITARRSIPVQAAPGSAFTAERAANS